MKKDLETNEGGEVLDNEEGLLDRRDFLVGLKKWSKVVIGGVLIGAGLLGTDKEAAAWVNGGAGWVNRYGGGGAWVNHAVGGGAWANRAGGGGAWANRGGSWVNRW